MKNIDLKTNFIEGETGQLTAEEFNSIYSELSNLIKFNKDNLKGLSTHQLLKSILEIDKNIELQFKEIKDNTIILRNEKDYKFRFKLDNFTFKFKNNLIYKENFKDIKDLKELNLPNKLKIENIIFENGSQDLTFDIDLKYLPNEKKEDNTLMLGILIKDLKEPDVFKCILNKLDNQHNFFNIINNFKKIIDIVKEDLNKNTESIETLKKNKPKSNENFNKKLELYNKIGSVKLELMSKDYIPSYYFSIHDLINFRNSDEVKNQYRKSDISYSDLMSRKFYPVYKKTYPILYSKLTFNYISALMESDYYDKYVSLSINLYNDHLYHIKPPVPYKINLDSLSYAQYDKTTDFQLALNLYIVTDDIFDYYGVDKPTSDEIFKFTDKNKNKTFEKFEKSIRNL